MKQEFTCPVGSVSKDTVRQHLMTMLEASRQEIRSEEVTLERYDTDPKDISYTTDPDELLVSGKFYYYRIALDDRQKKTSHTFKIRRVDDQTIRVEITDHANILPTY